MNNGWGDVGRVFGRARKSMPMGWGSISNSPAFGGAMSSARRAATGGRGLRGMGDWLPKSSGGVALFGLGGVGLGAAMMHRRSSARDNGFYQG